MICRILGHVWEHLGLGLSKAYTVTCLRCGETRRIEAPQ